MAQETNMAALGVGVLLFGGWLLGLVLLLRRGAKNRAAHLTDAPAPPADEPHG